MIKEVDYTISSSTMALEPIDKGGFLTKVYDESGIILSTNSPLELLINACDIRDSNYHWRINIVKKTLSFYKKTPLVICPIESIYAFPTTSPQEYHCQWIFPEHIDVYAMKMGRPVIIFDNELEMDLNCQMRILIEQLDRAKKCITHFRSLLQKSFIHILYRKN